MKDENQKQTIPSGFRHEAEEIVAKTNIVSEVSLSDANILTLLHEFEVQKVELELQSKELQKVKDLNNLLSETLDIGNLAYWEMKLPSGELMRHEKKANLLGFPPEQFKLHADYSSLIHPDHFEYVMSAMEDHLEGKKEKFESEYRIRAANGEYRWFHDIGRITSFGNDGKPMTVRGMVADITESRKSELASRESEFFFRETQRAAFIGSYKTDFVKALWESSEILDQIFGIDKNYVRSIQGWLDLVHPDDLLMMDNHLKRDVIAKREPFNKEYRIIRWSDGEIRWVSGLGKAEFDNEGNIISLIGTIQDITKRKQNEEALRQSEEKWKSIILTSPDGIAIAELDGTLIFASDKLRAIYGYNSIEEITAEKLTEFVDESYYEKLNSLIDDLLKGNHHPVSEYLLRKKDGTRFFMEVNAELLNDSLGIPNRIFFILRDITTRKNMEAAIEKRIVALTRPLTEDTTILFDELFDLNTIQAIQDSFADATGVTSLIVFPDGTPVTRPSRFTRLCNNIIRQTEKGCANCMKSDVLLGAPNLDGPIIKLCLSGRLWDAGASISVGGRHIASWLIGQVRDETQTEESMLAYAREIGADETEFLEAFRELPVVPYKQFEKVAQSLFLLANQLSASAYQNIQQSRFISERAQAEKDLTSSEKQFRDFFENAADAIFVADIDSKIIVDANLAASRLMQMPREKIIGLHQLQLHPPDNKGHSEKTFEFHQQTAVEIGSVYPVENQILRADGLTVPVEILASIVTINGKQCLLGTFRDITERKFMEDTVAENEQRYRQLVETSPYGIIVHQGGQFVYVNPAAVKLLGAADVTEVLGLPVLSVVHPNMRSEIIKRMKLVIEGTPVPPIEVTIIRLDGSQFDAEVITISTQYNNKPAGQVIVRDITYSKLAKAEIYKLNDELEQRVLERTKELEEANKELESFSYSVSHDLRSPLRSLDGFANILLEDYGTVLDAEGKRLLGVIIKNANKMSELIDDLLAFSRLGRREIQKERIDIHGMALSVYEELVTDADKENIHFRLQQIPETFGDPALIRQVLTNLISNAVKYTSKKPDRIIEICYSTVDDKTIYSIKDNGAGFDMANYGKLFGVFQRLHTVKDFDGIGIGLAIVQRIVNRHKGNIWAEAEVGKGATFYFTLPALKVKSEK